MPRWANRSFLFSALIAVGLCGAALAVRAAYHVPFGDGLDGAYYFQIARRVAEGRGLETTYSVFHMGLSPLPQRATTYPLLPLLIGTLGRFWPLASVAVWLPGAAYVLSIGLAFGFLLWATERSMPHRSALERRLLCAALALWLALIPDYVWTSARPYTEPLGTVLVLATLWAFGHCSGAHFSGWGKRAAAFAGVGLLGGLCYLARFQLLVVPVAIVLARALARDRRALRDAAWLALGAAPCLGWQAWRQLSLPNGEAVALLDFAAYRQMSSLPRFDYQMPFDSRWAWLADKLHGVLISLSPFDGNSYLVQLSYLTWLAPLGVACLVIERAARALRYGRRALQADALRKPRHAALVASAWVGLLAVLPIHTVHSLRWRDWAFAWRQGLPLVFLIIPSAVWLWSRRAWLARALVALTLVVSLVICGQKTQELLAARPSPRMFQGYADVAAYLDSVGPTHGTLGMEHQSLAVFTDAPLYWLACWSPPELASTLLRELPIERIVLRPGELGCSSLSGIRSRLRLERSVDAHYPMRVYTIER